MSFFFVGFLLVFSVSSLHAEEKASVSPTPTATATPVSSEATKNQNTVLTIHKPRIPAAWGDVRQYRREERTETDGRKVIFHEFVLQDQKGIVRIATWHEYPEGKGFWSVLVWDES